LAPIDASNVRLCSYAGVVVQDQSGFHDEAKQPLGSGLLTALAAKHFEAEANALQNAGVPECPAGPMLGRFVEFFLLTLSSNVQAVNVEEQYPECAPGPYNGQFQAALDSGRWHNELTLYTSLHPKRP